MISKILKILGFQPRISSFSRSLEQFFLTVGQSNCGNEIPFYIDLELIVGTNARFDKFISESQTFSRFYMDHFESNADFLNQEK